MSDQTQAAIPQAQAQAGVADLRQAPMEPIQQSAIGLGIAKQLRREMDQNVSPKIRAIMHCAALYIVQQLAAAPHPQAAIPQAQAQAEPKPEDLIAVANITLDGSTLTLRLDQLGQLEHFIGDDDHGWVFELRIATMTRAEFDELGEFDGF